MSETHVQSARGDFFGGRFHAPEGEPMLSRNPALESAPVWMGASDPARVGAAVAAAEEAFAPWFGLSFEARLKALEAFKAAIARNKEALAGAITAEMGKVKAESLGEVAALIGRFALVEAQIRADLRDGHLPGFPLESLRYRPHGVVGVLGPFNFPLHLCHAHVVPALMLGNTVVIKPSELTPWSGELYALCAEQAGLPPGVLNVVQGGGATGAALVAHPGVKGLCFTGSWATGRRIAEAALDRPEMLLALEMGGKNTCVVLPDADLRQAAHEIVVGGYLTTGQRCTCTDRVLVHESVRAPLEAALIGVLQKLRFGDPHDPASFAGPMASEQSRARLLGCLKVAREAGAEPLLEGAELPGGAYRTASLHRLPEGLHHVPGYTDTELFGPDLHLESVRDLEEAIAVLNASDFGFATSIFTEDDAAFERFYRESRQGILNRNRGTNQASPRLPFGGVGKSGNFRPAGAFAARNLAFPVAQQENPRGGISPHPQVAPHLPPADLGRLIATFEAEEEEEAARTLHERPRPLGTGLPRGGALPRSSAFLERFYAGERMAREKKPGLFDHLRSIGPWMVSVDEVPLSVLDGMSQTATHPLGFSADPLVKAFCEGGFGESPLLSEETALGRSEAALAYAEALRERVPGLPTVCFANSGAEANEKAFALCRLNGPAGATKVLAFEGSFHGRTLLSLYASYNPSKRLPFELAGYEVDFAPFPLWDGVDAPEDPEGLRALLAGAAAPGAMEKIRLFARETEDPLLGEEISSLLFVAQTLQKGEHYAVTIEPMQSEGGDRYASPRFYRGLRLLTRAFGVPLILDEVQCGFGLGGSFLWHAPYGLIDKDGRPDTADCVVFAKRAQVGVCMSRFEDPEPSSAFPASLVRGRLHLEEIDAGQEAARVEALVKPRLGQLASAFDELVESPRCQGFAVAFDLPTAAHQLAYLNQRFWRGAVVFGAGSRTIRYRLSSAYDEAAIDRLFDSMRRSLAWLLAHPGKQPPAWEDFPAKKPEDRVMLPVVLKALPGRLEGEPLEGLLREIIALEAEVYEPARRDSEAWLRMALEDRDGVAVIALGSAGGERILAGSALAVPLERVAEVEGPDRDPFLGAENTVYTLAVTVHPDYRGQGLGRRLKRALLAHAAERTRDDGSPRYQHATARNRVPDASAMSRLNDSLGAYTVALLEGQYEGDGVARYYRQPVSGRFLPPPIESSPEATSSDLATSDLASGLARPFAEAPASLRRAHARGALFGPTVNKITICNYITEAVVRAVEHASALTPDHPHLYLTSGRDEGVDKCVRLMRHARVEGKIVIALSGAYVGHTTACARSISDPSTHRQGPALFDWVRAPHPEEVGVEASIAAIQDAIEAAGGPDKVLGFVIDPIQERTGRTLSEEFLQNMEEIRETLKIPVALVETPGAYYRSGQGPFSGASAHLKAELLTWWTGGHAGFVHVDSSLFIRTPLTMVSTWDGDELSLIQADHQLRAARALDLGPAIAALEAALAPAQEAGLEVRGAGLYRVIACGEKGEALHKGLEAKGIRARLFPGGHLALAPALDQAEAQARALGAALKSALTELG